MPYLRAHNCPSCGAPLPSAGKGELKCDHCGRAYFVTAITGSLREAGLGQSAPPSVTRRPAKRSVWPKIVAGLFVVLLVAAGGYYLLSEKATDSRAVQSAALSPDGKLLATAHGQGLGTSGTILVWDLATGKEVASIDDLPTTWVVKWSPDGTLLAAGHHDGSIGVWSAGDWRRLAKLGGIGGFVDDIAWSADGTKIAVGDDYGKIRTWEAASGTPLYTHSVHEGNIERVVWSPDGTLIASSGWDNSVRIVDAVTGRQLLVGKDSNYVDAVAWSPDGALLASGGLANVIHIYDVSGAREVCALSGHKSSVRDVAWSPNGALLASTADDSSMRVWDWTTGAQLQAFDLGDTSEPNVQWSPDSTQVVGSGKGSVCIWATAGGALRRFGSGDGWRTTIVGWSPDGTKIVSLDRSDGAAFVWDAANGRELRELRMTLLEGIRRAFF